MRADRLVRTLLYLQGRPRVTATELAHELEVSLATARRDLEALGAAGIPVYPQPGRHGGWTLIGGARTDLTGLTALEARALFTLAGPAAAVSDDAKAALRKLVQALPSTFRADAVAATAATTIDATRWGGPPLPFLDALRGAVIEQRSVRLRYRGSAGAEHRWAIEPLGIVERRPHHYLLADTERGRRSFRVDRALDVEVTEDRFERPRDFDLDRAWRDSTEEVERRREATEAVVLVAAEHAEVLREQFGRHSSDHGIAVDGRVRVRVRASTATDIARWLAGWGAQAEVVEGEGVIRELVRLATEVTARYRIEH